MITYQTLGSADGTPLVFIHGLGAGKKQISSALTNLPGRWLITPNMPGHGDSTDIDPALFSFDFFADLVIEVMDHLGIDKTDLGGLSMGSGISLNIALRYPERVKKLILLRPSWLDSPRPDHLELVARVTTGMGANDPDFRALAGRNPPVAASIARSALSPVASSNVGDAPRYTLSVVPSFVTLPIGLYTSSNSPSHFSMVPLIRYWFHLNGLGGSNSAIGSCLELAFMFLFN